METYTTKYGLITLYTNEVYIGNAFMELDDIGYIHCDAQGAENFIFSKGMETIRKYRPVILYENNEHHGRYL